MVVGDFVIDEDVVVIGAGPGGYTAAIRAAQLGKSVLLIEKEEVGGVCLNRGCIPSKALISTAHQFQQAKDASNIGLTMDNIRVDFAKVQEWKRAIVHRLTEGVTSLLKENRIQRVQGEAFLVNQKTVSVVNGDDAKRYRFNHCIIATGSRPLEMKSAPFGARILSSTEALALQEIPRSLIVIGGGYIGIELGQMFAKLGTKVHIIEGTGSILSGFEQEMSRYVCQDLKKLDAHVYTNSTVQNSHQSENGVTVILTSQGLESKIEAEYVLVTVGRRPNTDDMGLREINLDMTERGHIAVNRQCKTSIEGIYAIGDIVEGPALAHKASYEGKVAAEAIAGLSSEIDHQAIPLVVFSSPEIASVGLSHSEAENQGYSVTIGKSLYKFNGRALSMNEAEGFVKLVGDKETGRLLGAQIVGSDASNLIAEMGLAIEMGAMLEDISLTVHAHPTLGEMLMEAAEQRTIRTTTKEDGHVNCG